ncbi:MAG TPA: formate dehydrogenase accessory sulfurtransferase FdhD, partial [Thermoanaerobaculia bacterium]
MNSTERVRIRTREADSETEREDVLAVEEPLEIRVRPETNAAATSFVTTMRTPGADENLATGLLYAEGVLQNRADLLSLTRPADPRIDADLRANVLIATLAPEAFERAGKLQRGTVMGSACGVCGKTSIENVIPSD